MSAGVETAALCGGRFTEDHWAVLAEVVEIVNRTRSEPLTLDDLASFLEGKRPAPAGQLFYFWRWR